MHSKLFLFLSFPIIALLVTACCEEVDKPYYTFSDVDLYYSYGVNVAPDEQFELYVEDFGIEYVAKNESFFNLIPAAHATQPCPSNGHLGRKNAIVSIAVTSDADYDDTHPAGSALADITFFRGYDVDAGEYILKPHASIEGTNQVNYENDFIFRDRPTASNVHVFTVSILKSNGEIIIAESDTITWM